jgi:hypothetical protein
VGREIDEDLIEATIRRVAESKAAREAPAIEMPVAESIAPEIEKPDVEKAIEQAEREPAPAHALDEIEATIRRVAESKAAREAPAMQMPVAESIAPEDDADDFEVTPTPLMAASRGRGIARPLTAAAAAREPEHSWDGGGNDAGIALQLADIKRQLDAITSMLQELTGGSAPSSIGPAWEQAAAATAVQRPAIFRDNGARVPAPELEPEIIDTRPIPEPLPPLHVDEPKRGFDLLPRSYRITVEDKRRGVDLVPLHRALLSMEGVRDMSLLSYNNGVAIVALETTTELEPDALGAQVSRAMSRDARVEVHNEHTMVVKLAEE